MATRKSSNVRRRPTRAATETTETVVVNEDAVDETGAPVDITDDFADAPTTKAPDGEEAVVTIDGDPIQPNFDGSDGGTEITSGVTVTQSNPVASMTPPDTTKGITTEVPEGKEKLTEEDMVQSPYRAYWQGVLDASGVQPPQGRILFPGEPLTFQGNTIKKDHIILGEDIYRMVLPHRARRPVFTLEARAGKRINRARVLTKEEYLDAVDDLYDTYGV